MRLVLVLPHFAWSTLIVLVVGVVVVLVPVHVVLVWVLATTGVATCAVAVTAVLFWQRDEVEAVPTTTAWAG